MISVLTITYQRKEFLEEAMESFLRQDYLGESEMIILNDSPQVMYRFNHPKIRIINWPWRFPSIGKKLEFGFKMCSGDYVFRLDDDDLLMSNALSLTQAYIDEKPDQDVYRSKHFYLFGDNKYERISDGINNGNVLSRDYINRIEFPDKTADEDLDIVFSEGVKMHTADHGKYAMIYRWGMNTYHISTQLHLDDKERLKFIKEPENGFIDLNPHFDNDYYGQIPNEI